MNNWNSTIGSKATHPSWNAETALNIANTRTEHAKKIVVWRQPNTAPPKSETCTANEHGAASCPNITKSTRTALLCRKHHDPFFSDQRTYLDICLWIFGSDAFSLLKQCQPRTSFRYEWATPTPAYLLHKQNVSHAMRGARRMSYSALSTLPCALRAAQKKHPMAPARER